MSEWSSYRLRDLLLFSARTYDRLFESYNAAIWPAQILALSLALGIAILVLQRRGSPRAQRGIAAILAAGWVWTGVAFVAQRYAAINWSAVYFAWAFGLEAALLLWLGVVRGSLAFERPADLPSRFGFGVFLFALAGMPLLAPLLGRGWRGAQLFLLCPDPTAIGALGLLLAARGPRRAALMIVPVLWCLYTAIFLLAMKAPDWWIPPLLAGLSVISLTRKPR
jgi:Family of unknown function (DUF6064)